MKNKIGNQLNKEARFSKMYLYFYDDRIRGITNGCSIAHVVYYSESLEGQVKILQSVMIILAESSKVFFPLVLQCTKPCTL